MILEYVWRHHESARGLRSHDEAVDEMPANA